MPVGHPDSASVRRHFFGRTVLSQSANLAANEFAGFSITEADCADCVVIRLFTTANVKYQIHTYGVAGDVVETYELGMDVSWPSARRIVVQPMGGGIDVLVQETAGAAGSSYNFQVDAYIGADAQMLRINHAKLANIGSVIAAGATSTRIVLPECCIYDAVDMWLQTNSQPCTMQAIVVDNGDSTAGAMTANTDNASLVVVTNNVLKRATIPTNGIGMYFNVINNSAASATIRFGYRAHRVA